MRYLPIHEVKNVYQIALENWSSPSKKFASGADPRSSDNALLVLIHGSLKKAQEKNWLNAGRRLIDKTYLQILFDSQGISSNSPINCEATSAALDNFIRNTIAPNYSILQGKGMESQTEFAIKLIMEASTTLFGSSKNLSAASYLLFYLCPTLPFYPVTSKHIEGLEKFSYSVDSEDYSGYIKYCEKSLSNIKSHLNNVENPNVQFGNTVEMRMVNQILMATDWWHRNMIQKLLLY